MLGLLLRLGAILLLTALFGLGLGVLADAQAGTKPLFTLVFSVAGMTMGSYTGYRLVAAALTALGDSSDAARSASEAGLGALVEASARAPRPPD